MRLPTHLLPSPSLFAILHDTDFKTMGSCISLPRPASYHFEHCESCRIADMMSARAPQPGVGSDDFGEGPRKKRPRISVRSRTAATEQRGPNWHDSYPPAHNDGNSWPNENQDSTNQSFGWWSEDRVRPKGQGRKRRPFAWWRDNPVLRRDTDPRIGPFLGWEGQYFANAGQDPKNQPFA